MPGSHHTFVAGVGETPEDNYKSSLQAQELGIDQFTGPAGSALWFDSNIMHGSGNNITPFPRSNIFLVFNSVENTLSEPFRAGAPRPNYIATRDTTPLS